MKDKNFTLEEKREYYNSRLGVFDSNKRNYARGFVNGSSVNQKERHYKQAKRDLYDDYQELKTCADAEDRRIVISSICYLKGQIAGYEAKMKEKK